MGVLETRARSLCLSLSLSRGARSLCQSYFSFSTSLNLSLQSPSNPTMPDVTSLPPAPAIASLCRLK